MKLAVFDLDGTLTATNEVDSRCFAAALREVCGEDVATDWSRYRHPTDAGIAAECFHAARGRRATPHDLERIREAFLGRLRGTIAAHPVAEIRGAGSLLAALPAHGWRPCIATGAWEASARLKIASAGLPDDLPLASADDHAARREIVRRAMARAGEAYGAPGSPPFDRVVLVGDAAWDCATAAGLGLPFVAVTAASGERALRALGARCFLRDYADPEAALAALASATPPQSPGVPLPP